MKKEPLECLTPEAITNRFLESNSAITDYFITEMLKAPPWFEVFAKEAREKEIEKLVEGGMTRKKAEATLKAKERKEKKEWEKHYNSPLGKAERRIQELERHLELIKEVINDPNYLDRYD